MGSTVLWEKSLTELEEWLTFQNTDPALTNMIILGLKSWTQRQPMRCTLSAPYAEVWNLQDQIGWDSLLEGRMIAGWSTLQDYFFRQNQFPSSRTGLRWLTSVLRRLMDIAWDQWEHRNGILHDSSLGARRLELQRQVRFEFQKGTARIPPLQRLFTPGIQRISKRSLPQLEQWISIVAAHRANPPVDRALQSQQALMRQFLSRPSLPS